MKRALLLLGVLACLGLSLGFGTAAFAATLATVEAVQPPAWIERNGALQPLAPDMALTGGDIVHTGAGARAYLRLAEGSRVKLGEAARFALHSQSARPQESFSGALDVIAGAFRFTSGIIKRAVTRNVQIRVGTATVGIRGTDIWGKSTGTGDIVALLAGRIEITRGGETVEMNEPQTYFDAPRAAAGMVKPLDPATLAHWARETEILPGDGSSRRHGRWHVQVATAASREAALETYDRLRHAGFAARIRPFKPDAASAWQYEIRLAGFADQAEAAAVAARLTAHGFAAMASR